MDSIRSFICYSFTSPCNTVQHTFQHAHRSLCWILRGTVLPV